MLPASRNEQLRIKNTHEIMFYFPLSFFVSFLTYRKLFGKSKY